MAYAASMSSAESESNQEDLVVLCEAPSEFAARSLIIVLEEAGITAVTFGAGQLPSIPTLTSGRARGVAVHVARRDEHRARVIVDELPRRASDIDWESIDVGESNDADESAGPPDLADERPTSFLDHARLPRILLVLGAIGLTLAVLGFLIEVWRRA